jgi:hypothetical protein
MTWLMYRRPGAVGMTRVRLTRGRRRMLLTLLADPPGLHARQLCVTSHVGPGRAYPFLEHLENARWVTSDYQVVGARDFRCYQLTETGRAEATRLLRLRD